MANAEINVGFQHAEEAVQKLTAALKEYKEELEKLEEQVEDTAKRAEDETHEAKAARVRWLHRLLDV